MNGKGDARPQNERISSSRWLQVLLRHHLNVLQLEVNPNIDVESPGLEQSSVLVLLRSKERKGTNVG